MKHILRGIVPKVIVTSLVVACGVSGAVYALQTKTPQQPTKHNQTNNSAVVPVSPQAATTAPQVATPQLPAAQTPTATPVATTITESAAPTTSTITNPFPYGWALWHVFNRRLEVGKDMPAFRSNNLAYFSTVPDPLFSSTPTLYAIARYHGSHALFVEQVNPDGSFWASQMNAVGQVSMTDTTITGGIARVSYRLVPPSDVWMYTFIQ